MSIFATKSIEQIQTEQLGHGNGELKRVLGPAQLIMLGVGAIIGTGIFVLTGQAAAANAGPAIVLSMVLAGVTSVLAALCYSEFASSVPVAGSAYTYAYATLGEFIAWVIGWDLILEYALGAATVAVGWSGNLVTLLTQLGMTFPAAISAAPGTLVPVPGGGSGDGGLQPARRPDHHRGDGAPHRRRQRIRHGQRRHRRHQGGGRPDRDRRGCVLHPDRRTGIRSFPPTPGTSASTAGAACCAAPASSSSPTSDSTPCRRPRRRRAIRRRDMPRGILGSLAICTVLFVLVSGVMVGLVPYREMLNQPAPLVIAIEAAAGRARRARRGRR